MNAYKITWAILEPIKGKVTKADADKMNIGRMFANKMGAKCFGNIDAALSWVKEQAPAKKYNVRFICDKQFGMITYTNGQYAIPFTTKQANNVYIIG